MEIKKTNEIVATNLNCLIYAPSGHGKTTLAGTLPPSTIIVSMESGLLSLRGKTIDYIVIKNLDELKTALVSISKSNYENVFFDSLTEIASLFVDKAQLEYPDDRQALKKWGAYNELIVRFIKFTRDWNKNVFFTCLEKTDKDESGRRFNLPDLQGSISKKISAYMDFVFSLRIFEKDGQKVRALLTNATDGYICKDRSGLLDEYEKPDLSEIIGKIFKEKRNV